METTDIKKKFARIDLKASKQDETNLQKAAQKMGTTKVSETIFNSVQQVANQPVEFYCDRPAIKAAIVNIEYGRLHLNSFIQEFKAVTGEYLTIEELQNCFAGIGKLGSKVILESAIQELVTKKLYDRMVAAHPDMVVLADNVPAKDMTALFSIANKLDNIPEVKMFFIGIQWTCYNVNELGEVTIIQENVDQICNSYRSFASTPDELQKLAKIKKICDALNELIDQKDIEPTTFSSAMVTYYDNELGRFVPSGGYVKLSLTPKVFFKH